MPLWVLNMDCAPMLIFVYLFHLKTRYGCITNDTPILTRAVRVHIGYHTCIRLLIVLRDRVVMFVVTTWQQNQNIPSYDVRNGWKIWQFQIEPCI